MYICLLTLSRLCLRRMMTAGFWEAVKNISLLIKQDRTRRSCRRTVRVVVIAFRAAYWWRMNDRARDPSPVVERFPCFLCAAKHLLGTRAEHITRRPAAANVPVPVYPPLDTGIFITRGGVIRKRARACGVSKSHIYIHFCRFLGHSECGFVVWFRWYTYLYLYYL